MTIQHQDEYDKPWKPQPLHTPTVDYSKSVVPEQLPPLESATILRLEPGDVLVIRSSRGISPKVKREWVADLERVLAGHKAIILDSEGLDLQVARPAKATEAT